MTIQNYDDFVAELLKAGFSMGGGNDEGTFALIPYSWDNTPEDAKVRWHTGDADTDPWEWRIRVLDERRDIAYSKLFFKKSGYITRQWYPCFLAARRGAADFEEAYADGKLSYEAKRIYSVLSRDGTLPLHAIKALAGFSKEEKSAFDRALTELQMKLYITTCGRQQKLSKAGEEYGWSSTVFCMTETFWDAEVFKEAAKLSQQEAAEKIMAQLKSLNPAVKDTKAKKFIMG